MDDDWEAWIVGIIILVLLQTILIGAMFELWPHSRNLCVTCPLFRSSRTSI